MNKPKKKPAKPRTKRVQGKISKFFSNGSEKRKTQLKKGRGSKSSRRPGPRPGA